MGKIVIAGDLRMHLTVRVVRQPVVGETIRGEEFSALPGGKGVAQAVTAASLGAEVAMIGCVGSDGYGQAVLEHLRAHGIDESGIQVTPDAPTSISIRTIIGDNPPTTVLIAGANQRLTIENVESFWERAEKAAVAIAHMSVPTASLTRFCQLAHQNQATVIVDTSPPRSLPEDLYPVIDILVLDQHSASVLTAVDIISPKTAEMVSRRLIAQGVKTVVMNLGEKGVLVTDEKGNLTHLRREEGVMVDPVKAGNALVAALAAGLAGKRSLNSAVRMAVAHASGKKVHPLVMAP